MQMIYRLVLSVLLALQLSLASVLQSQAHVSGELAGCAAGTGHSSEALFVTGEHPFWVTDKQKWITVDDIEVGAKLTNHQGDELNVLGKVLQTELQQTYNITVSGNNNYFAGRLETLVHNCGPKGPKSSEFVDWRKKQSYDDASYHTSGSSVKNPKPTNPDIAFDNSYTISGNTGRRIGADKLSGEFVVFDHTGNSVWHGHSRTWGELNNRMQAALRSAGVVTKKGKIK